MSIGENLILYPLTSGFRLKFHLWYLLCLLRGLEILLLREAEPARIHNGRNTSDVRVVRLHGFVIAPSFRSDAVFGAGEFIREPGELGISFQLGIVFRER